MLHWDTESFISCPTSPVMTMYLRVSGFRGAAPERLTFYNADWENLGKGSPELSGEVLYVMVIDSKRQVS